MGATAALQALQQREIEAVGKYVGVSVAGGVRPHCDGIVGVQLQDVKHARLLA